MSYFGRLLAARRRVEKAEGACCFECAVGGRCEAEIGKQVAPFSPDDAVQHIGDVDNAKRREWAQVANTTLRAEVEAGTSEEAARRRAIRAANERFEKQGGRCPPGQVWRGGRCVPGEAKKGMGVGDLRSARRRERRRTAFSRSEGVPIFRRVVLGQG